MSHKRHAALPLRVLQDGFHKFHEDEGAFMARGLAFSVLIYCIPLALLTVSALSYTIVGSERALLWIRRFSEALIPQFRDEFSRYLTSVVQNRGVLGLAGFLAFIFVSSTTFGSLRLVLNKVFQVSERRGFIHGKAMEMIMTMVTSALFFVIIAAVYGFELVQSFLIGLPFTKGMFAQLKSDFPGLPHYLHPVTITISGIASFLATAALFWFLYRFSPARTLRWESLIVGATTGAALFEVSKLAFAAYMRYAQGTTALYGTLSGLIFFFLWIYYACTVFVLGAEVSWVFEHRKD
jgi:membrane protein